MVLQELEKYRDDTGYIDMDLFFKDYPEMKKSLVEETRGSSNRNKNWLDFEDAGILLRDDLLRDEGVIFTGYAELLTEEVAKQVGIPAAHYDLIKHEGKLGVFSQKVVDLDKNESLLSIAELIQNNPKYARVEDTIASIGFNDILESIGELKEYDANMTDEQTDSMIEDIQRLAIFDIFNMNTDRNGGNFAIIQTPNGSRLAPIFDNEMCFGGCLDLERVKEVNGSKYSAKFESESLMPVLEISEDDKDYYIENWKSFSPRIEDSSKRPLEWQMFLMSLNDNAETSRIEEMFEEMYSSIDLDKAFASIEERIHADVPREYKKCVKELYTERRNYIQDTLCFEDLEIEGEQI